MINVKPLDGSRIQITTEDSGILLELNEHFSFFVDGYRFMPAFKERRWDGKIKLFNTRDQTLPHGLVEELIKFSKTRKYKLNLHSDFAREIPTDEYLENFVAKLDIRSSNGDKIQPRDYQLDAFKQAIKCRRKTILSPTGSGKSLIIYMLVRYYLEHEEDKALIIVPTVMLTTQMAKDFIEYSSNDPDFGEEDIHKISAGIDKNPGEKRLVCATWQSAIKCDHEWFKQFGLAVGDEVHTAAAKSFTTIMQRLIFAEYKIGCTGTLAEAKANEFVIIGEFGPVYSTISTQQLIEGNTLSQLKIKALVLKHSDELKKACKTMNYHGEIDIIVSHPGRNNFIKNLTLGLKGNSLVLFNLVSKHGKPLHKLIEEAAPPGRKVYYISGEVKASEREEIRVQAEKEDGCIIVASYATLSTGINIKNLHNVVFAAPSKSKIKVLQSIGRGLRKSDDGKPCSVYDISDDLSWKKRKNYTLKHGAARIGFYDNQGFDYNVYPIDI